MNNLNDYIEIEQNKLDIIKKISKLYPTVQFVQTRWNKYLCADEINQIATNVDFTHSCGCCEDSVLYAMPYIIFDNTKIYSNPPQILIGEKCSSGGEIASDNWQIKLREHQINNNIVLQIQKFFANNKPCSNDDE